MIANCDIPGNVRVVIESSILQRENLRQLGAGENLYFQPLKGNKAFCTSRPTNDKL